MHTYYTTPTLSSPTLPYPTLPYPKRVRRVRARSRAHSIVGERASERASERACDTLFCGGLSFMFFFLFFLMTPWQCLKEASGGVESPSLLLQVSRLMLMVQ